MGAATDQYQRSMWSVCSLFRLASTAFRMYSGSFEKMRVPSARPLTANLVARKILSFSQHSNVLKPEDQGRAYLIALPSPLEPFANQLFVVSIALCSACQR